MDKVEILQDVTFGGRTAEEESGKLAAYFVETEQWRKVWEGDVDVVFAPKGGGKSAIYSMLVSREDALFDRGIILAPGENPTGATAFEPIENDPPTGEAEFMNLWRLYLLVLIADELENYGITSEAARELIASLSGAGLRSGPVAKRTLVKRVQDYIKRFTSAEAIEGSVAIDPGTGMPVGFGGKISFGEPTSHESSRGTVSVDALYELAESALAAAEVEVWLMLDRLDIAFADSAELEANALRALFRVYRLLEPLSHIQLKIFLRTDIWEEITSTGFREASHITRDLSLQWTRTNLLQLVVRRLVQSAKLCSHYGIQPDAVIADTAAQKRVFESAFPAQVDAGSRKPATYDWCLSRTRDGKGVTAPRELIHLLNATRDRQLHRIDVGEPLPPGTILFEPQALKEALPVVSEARLEKTLFAEYPQLKDYLEALRGQRTHQSVLSLAHLWGLSIEEAGSIAKRLADVGFFETLGDVQNRTYKVPFLYRPALELVQGSADGVNSSSDEDEGEAA